MQCAPDVGFRLFLYSSARGGRPSLFPVSEVKEAPMAIKKLEEIRLNVQPVSIEFVHEYVFEGPCRFGKGDALTKPFDEMIN